MRSNSVSFQSHGVVLLPKKGDLSDLSNWRPITHINTDCKVFTRMLNSRVMTVAGRLINKIQTGFMHGRYIGDQGIALRVMMDNAKTTKANNKEEFEEYVGVMLDNNKAYDRVHPRYLEQVLHKFGFPLEFIRCIENLFFDNELSINMNGFLSKPVKQKRGLRQGDSISPILFNFAIEPFILSIINNNTYLDTHYNQPSQLTREHFNLTPPTAIKIMAYADDILIFVKSRPEYMEIEEYIKTYSRASNSKINNDKSIAIPLHSGKTEGCFGTRLKSYIQQQIKWFDYSSPEYIKYLGYPIYFIPQQRDCFIADLTAKIRTQVEFFKVRKLSLYGRANVANIIILSKLWHVLRLTPLPKTTINKLNSFIYQYIVDEKGLQIKKMSQNNSSVPISNYLTHTANGDNLPYIDTILIFKEARNYKNNLKDGALQLMLETMNKLLENCQPDFTNIPISINTCLALTLTAICKDWEGPEALKYLTNPTAKKSRVQDLFKMSEDQAGLQYKTRQECKKPQILYKFKRDHSNNQLHVQPFFAKLLQLTNSAPVQQEATSNLLQHFK